MFEMHKIESANLENLDTILFLGNECFEDFYSREACVKILKNNFCFLLKINNVAVGFICGTCIYDAMDIVSIGILKKFRNQGYGKILFEHVFEFAKNKGINSIFLEVATQNLPAIALYERLGFKQIGLRKRYYKTTSGLLDAYTYTKRIRPE